MTDQNASAGGGGFDGQAVTVLGGEGLSVIGAEARRVVGLVGVIARFEPLGILARDSPYVDAAR